MIEPMTEPGALSEFQQTRPGSAVVDARGNRGDKTILRKSQVGNQVVELKHEANFMAQKMKQVTAPMDLYTVD
jgi:hypothetical protein